MGILMTFCNTFGGYSSAWPEKADLINYKDKRQDKATLLSEKTLIKYFFIVWKY